MTSLIHGSTPVDPSYGVTCDAGTTAPFMGVGAPARTAPLGNNTKLSANRVSCGLESNPSKYVLRAVAQSVLGRSHRISSCQKVPSYSVQQGEKERGISKNEDGKAFFHGVGACGDVHTCPVCSHKISESRRQELLSALRCHRESGRIALLATFTFPHFCTDALSINLDLFRKARSRMVASRRFKDMKKTLGMIGYVRRLEVTWGEANGWHPHDHEIWFIDKPDITKKELKDIEHAMWELWSIHCEKVGLSIPSRSHGFDLRYNDQQYGDAVGAYLTKWGHELTYGHTKMTRGDRRHTPFSILAHLDKHGYHPLYHHLFREYAKTFKGRAQLLWSQGLKMHFAIDSVSDEEISDRPEPVHHCEITKEQHTAISLLNLFSEVLHFAEKHTPQQTIEFMDRIVEYKNKPSIFWSAINNDQNFRNFRKHLGKIISDEISEQRTSTNGNAERVSA